MDIMIYNHMFDSVYKTFLWTNHWHLVYPVKYATVWFTLFWYTLCQKFLFDWQTMIKSTNIAYLGPLVYGINLIPRG